ncbi:hypothetical protein ACNI0M_17165, partial [Escherichia coli]
QMLHLHSAISPYLSGGNCNISVNLHSVRSFVMTLQKACKWVVTNIIVPVIIGASSSVLASVIASLLHIA